MSREADFSFVDDDDIARSSKGIILACPVCGEAEVVAAFDSMMVEKKPNSSPLGTEGPWIVVPMMCADEDCGAIFGVVIGTENLTTAIGYAVPEGGIGE